MQEIYNLGVLGVWILFRKVASFETAIIHFGSSQLLEIYAYQIILCCRRRLISSAEISKSSRMTS